MSMRIQIALLLQTKPKEGASRNQLRLPQEIIFKENEYISLSGEKILQQLILSQFRKEVYCEKNEFAHKLFRFSVTLFSEGGFSCPGKQTGKM